MGFFSFFKKRSELTNYDEYNEETHTVQDMSHVPRGELSEYFYGTRLDDVDPYGDEPDDFYLSDSTHDDSSAYDEFEDDY